MHVCMYARTYVGMYVHTGFVHMCTMVCTYACINNYINICIYLFSFVCLYVYLPIHLHMCICGCGCKENQADTWADR